MVHKLHRRVKRNELTYMLSASLRNENYKYSQEKFYTFNFAPWKLLILIFCEFEYFNKKCIYKKKAKFKAL